MCTCRVLAFSCCVNHKYIAMYYTITMYYVSVITMYYSCSRSCNCNIWCYYNNIPIYCIILLIICCRISMSKRLIGSMVLMIVMFILTLIFTKLDVTTCKWPTKCTWIVILKLKQALEKVSRAKTNYPNWYIWNRLFYSLFSHTYQNFLVWFACLNALPQLSE